MTHTVEMLTLRQNWHIHVTLQLGASEGVTLYRVAYGVFRHASSNSNTALANIHIFASRSATLVSTVRVRSTRPANGDTGVARGGAIAIPRWAAGACLTQPPGGTQMVANRARVEEGVRLGTGTHASVRFHPADGVYLVWRPGYRSRCRFLAMIRSL